VQSEAVERDAQRAPHLHRLSVTAVHLSFDEIASLWMASSARVASALPWGGSARSALDKLLVSVPEARAKELRSLLRRVVIGAPAPAELVAGAGRPTGELLGCVEQAFRRGIAIAFDYRDRHGKATRRSAEPHGLLVQPPIWYVLAIDVDKKVPRMFRMDRISRPTLIKGHAFVPKQSVAAVPHAFLRHEAHDSSFHRSHRRRCHARDRVRRVEANSAGRGSDEDVGKPRLLAMANGSHLGDGIPLMRS